jgi:hypothetical protein
LKTASQRSTSGSSTGAAVARTYAPRPVPGTRVQSKMLNALSARAAMLRECRAPRYETHT